MNNIVDNPRNELLMRLGRQQQHLPASVDGPLQISVGFCHLLSQPHRVQVHTSTKAASISNTSYCQLQYIDNRRRQYDNLHSHSSIQKTIVSSKKPNDYSTLRFCNRGMRRKGGWMDNRWLVFGRRLNYRSLLQVFSTKTEYPFFYLKNDQMINCRIPANGAQKKSIILSK